MDTEHTPTGEEDAVVAAVQAGDEAAFARIVERHRRELQVHAYRMLGSLEEAEDMVQETFLRAWRRRDTFAGRATLRAWLYRIATNACLDLLARERRRPRVLTTSGGGRTKDVPWLQPYPDHLLEPPAPDAEAPDTLLVAKETIELAFLAAIQHLPPRQRAVLVMRDVLGWPATETAAQLDMSVAAVKSALQRARPALKQRLPERRSEWTAATANSAEEQELLDRFVAASERADMAGLAGLLRGDALQTMPPHPLRFDGRDAILAMWSQAMVGPEAMGRWQLVPTRANHQPAVANYVRGPDDDVFRASNLDVLRIEDGRIAEIMTFDGRLFAAFGLPETV